MSATTTHAADGRPYSERDYIDRTIATIRQHEPDALRENWWTGAALALADEVDQLRTLADRVRRYCETREGEERDGFSFMAMEDALEVCDKERGRE